MDFGELWVRPWWPSHCRLSSLSPDCFHVVGVTVASPSQVAGRTIQSHTCEGLVWYLVNSDRTGGKLSQGICLRWLMPNILLNTLGIHYPLVPTSVLSGRLVLSKGTAPKTWRLIVSQAALSKQENVWAGLQGAIWILQV